MTAKRFLVLAFVVVLCLGIIKLLFTNFLADTSAFYYLELVLIALVSMAASRRLGTINYLEALLAIGMWWLFALVFDFFITSAFVGFEIFRDGHFWIGYLVMGLAVFFFHKKRHIKLRHELHH